MGKPKILKTKEERVSEGMHLLKQLLDAGVKQHLSFQDLKQKISEWISTGKHWEGTVAFPEYKRVAEVNLPQYNNHVAEINFKVKRTAF